MSTARIPRADAAASRISLKRAIPAAFTLGSPYVAPCGVTV
jgi:hypothetical protein